MAGIDGMEGMENTEGTVRPRPFDGVPSVLAARGRRRAVGAGIVAAAVAVVVSGVCEVVDPPHQDPGNHAAPAPCTLGRAGLVVRADVDGDGHADVIEDAGGGGGRPRVTFDGGKGVSVISTVLTPWQKLRIHIGVDEGARAAFGDFDGDGHLDLVVFAAAPDEGDDPMDTMTVHEAHWGPLGRDLRGRETTSVRMPYKHWIDAVRVVHQGPDTAAELRVFQSSGDGVVAEYASRTTGRTVTVSQDVSQSYDVGDRPSSQEGWADFRRCST